MNQTRPFAPTVHEFEWRVAIQDKPSRGKMGRHFRYADCIWCGVTVRLRADEALPTDLLCVPVATANRPHEHSYETHHLYEHTMDGRQVIVEMQRCAGCPSHRRVIRQRAPRPVGAPGTRFPNGGTKWAR